MTVTLRHRCSQKNTQVQEDSKVNAEVSLSERAKDATISHHRVIISGLVCTIAVLTICILGGWDWLLANGPLPRAGTSDKLEPITVLDIKDLTFRRFYQEFREGDRPLIIKGIPMDQQPCFGGLGAFNDTFLNDCAAAQVQLGKRVGATMDRKAIHDIGFPRFDHFFKMFLERKLEAHHGEGHYFAILNNIRTSCPNLWKHLRFPSFFTGQMLLQPSDLGNRGRIDIYFSDKGLNQSFHVDIPRGELWSNVCRGKKYYRVIPRSIASQKLGWGNKRHWTLLKRPDDWPLGMPVWHGEAGPGDLVYLPAGTVHAVDNLEQSVNIINDFVDVGELVPTSWTLEKMFRGACFLSRPLWLTKCHYPGVLGWMTDPWRRTPVYDAVGRVTDASQTPRGFPSWDQLAQWGATGY